MGAKCSVQLLERLFAGHEYDMVIRDLNAAGVVVPCPDCGSEIQVVDTHGFCSQSACRRFGWSGTTRADRDVIDRATRNHEK